MRVFFFLFFVFYRPRYEPRVAVYYYFCQQRQQDEQNETLTGAYPQGSEFQGLGGLLSVCLVGCVARVVGMLLLLGPRLLLL